MPLVSRKKVIGKAEHQRALIQLYPKKVEELAAVKPWVTADNLTNSSPGKGLHSTVVPSFCWSLLVSIY